MEFNEFVNEVRRHIKDYLPEEYKYADINISRVIKNNDSYLTGLTIRHKSTSLSPVVYLEEFYRDMREGESFDNVMSEIASFYKDAYIRRDIDISPLFDYEQIKDKIAVRLINKNANRQYLADKPHEVIEDLAAVYYIALSKNASVVIDEEMMMRYGISKDELYSNAIGNMEKHSYSFKSMKEQLTQLYAEEEGISKEEAGEILKGMLPDASDLPYVLTNEENLYGAAEILRDDVRLSIAEKIGDFYVLPSSVHEMLIVPKSAGMNLKELEYMVRDVNRTQVAPSERLSDNVYHVSAKTREFKPASKIQEKKQTDTKKQGKLR